MKKLIILLGLMVGLFGTGCSETEKHAPPDRIDYFVKKQECAKYRPALEKEKYNSDIHNVQILGAVCYSIENDTCIAYIEDVQRDDKYRVYQSFFTVKNILTGQTMDSTSFNSIGESTEAANKMHVEYFKETKRLREAYPCAE